MLELDVFAEYSPGVGESRASVELVGSPGLTCVGLWASMEVVGGPELTCVGLWASVEVVGGPGLTCVLCA